MQAECPTVRSTIPRRRTRKRALIGYVINASIRKQFEFLSRETNPKDDFVKSATGPEGAAAGNAVFNIVGEDVLSG